MDIVDPVAVMAAIEDVAAEEPGTVAEARRLLSDPALAIAADAADRQVAWLVALAARRRQLACRGAAA